MNDYFQFKQFTIQQGQTAMKVGTDGVLLGAWARLPDAASLLDIGTGTGLIALMAAQRTQHACIDAVEINPEAYRQACDNAAASPWAHRISLHLISVFDYHPEHPFDCILCNPPFYLHSTPAPDRSRTTARHCQEFTHTDLLQAARRLLKEQGRLNLILPTEEAEILLAAAPAYSAYPSRITRVKPTPHKPPKRYLMEFAFSPVSAPEMREITIEYARHQYSPEYRELTQSFYLNM